MIDCYGMVVNVLQDHVRVNETLKTVEIYNDFGVQLVLRNLSDDEFFAFSELFKNHY